MRNAQDCTGQEAVALASTFRPDIALMNLTQSGVNAVECAHMIAKQVPSCRIVLFSERIKSAELARVADSGGSQFDVLPKPISSHELLEAMAVDDQLDRLPLLRAARQHVKGN